MHHKLTIVTDTAIYFKDGKYFAFAPVVNEIISFEHLFEKITWIGFNRIDRTDDLSMKEINLSKVKIVLLENIGGKSFLSVLKILMHYPIMFFIVFKNIYNAQVVHTRAPSHPAFVAIILSFLLRKKIWWNKFAGSWDSKTLPFFYKLQKNILVNAKHTKVTINGTWKNQPSHCISFENPCLTSTDIQNGLEVSNAKNFIAPFRFIFIGRLDNAKGVDTIIKSLEEIPLEKIESVTFVGDGSNLEIYKKETAFLQSKVNFKGFLNQEAIHQLLKESHFIVLPSKSEGFPKVIAEAACYGVIPIVSNVGSIPHFITQNNGFVWDINAKVKYSEIIFNAINDAYLQEKSEKLHFLSQKFTFENYIFKLNKYIIN